MRNTHLVASDSNASAVRSALSLAWRMAVQADRHARPCSMLDKVMQSNMRDWDLGERLDCLIDAATERVLQPGLCIRSMMWQSTHSCSSPSYRDVLWRWSP